MVHWQAGLPEFFFMYGSSQQVQVCSKSWKLRGGRTKCPRLLNTAWGATWPADQVGMMAWFFKRKIASETMFFHLLPSNFVGDAYEMFPSSNSGGLVVDQDHWGPKNIWTIKKNGSINHLILREMTHVKPPARIHWFDSSKTKIWSFMVFFQVLWRLRRTLW